MPFDEGTIYTYLESVVKGKDKGHPLKSTGDFNKPGWKEERIIAGWHKLGEYPKDLLEEQHPNRSKEWSDWSKAVFQPITKSAFNRAIKSATALITQTNGSIIWPFEEDEMFLREKYWDWLVNRVLLDKYFLESNGVSLAFPPAIESVVEIDGELTIQEQIDTDNVKSWLIDSGQIHDKDDENLVFLDYEPNKFLYGDRLMDGKRYWVVDTATIWRCNQVAPGETLIESYEIEAYYVHDQGRIWQDIGGIREDREDKFLYRNFFGAYFPFANDALIAYDDAKIMAKTCAHAVPVMKSRPCNECDGTGKWYDDMKACHTCTNCNGTGDTVRYTYPGEGIIIEKPVQAAGEDAWLNVPELSFISPPAENIKLLDERWKNLADEGEKALNQRFIQEAQSGTAKEGDREDQRNDVAAFSKWIWGTFAPNDINNRLKIKYGDAWESHAPTIKPPNRFKIQTESELLEEIGKANEIGLPSAVRQQQVTDYIERKYANNPGIQRKMRIVSLLDPLFSIVEDDLPTMRNTGAADDEAIFRHSRALLFVEIQIEETGEDVLERDLAYWMGEFDKWVSANMPEQENPHPVGTFLPQ